MNVDLQKRWWIVPAVAGGLGVVLLVLVGELLPSLEFYAMLLFFLLVGLSFVWVFVVPRKFWAVAPGVGALGIAVALIVSQFIPENNGWVGTLILAVTVFVMAAIPNPWPPFKGVYAVGLLILLIGFMMVPLPVVWRIVLCVATVLVGAYLFWRDRELLSGSSTS